MAREVVKYEEEMDWNRTQKLFRIRSQHRHDHAGAPAAQAESAQEADGWLKGTVKCCVR